MISRLPFRIVGVYDTETSTVRVDGDYRAFTYLYIYNDIEGVDLESYEAGRDDSISLMRDEADMLDKINEAVRRGITGGYVPIICAYNLMFDLQTIMAELAARYSMTTSAQSSTNVYTLDLHIGKRHVLRLWDTFHLEMNGLAAMGRAAGLPKATGDLDYSLVRTPDTELTDVERRYCERDVQVIPAYLRYLLQANEWLTADMLGCKVITKTSLVRQMAARKIGNLTYVNAKGKRVKLSRAFELTCAQNMPKCYSQHAIRKASFRGGLAFTAANLASQVWENVYSLDVTSMHHLFINGRYVPVRFEPMHPRHLQPLLEKVVSTSVENVLKTYAKPFYSAFHARVRFTNLRLRQNSAFARWGIGLLAESKFKRSAGAVDIGEDERAKAAEADLRSRGWVDVARDPVFAFSKLMSATEAEVHVSEIELFAMSRVYEWDSMEAICGEATRKFIVPPDYVTLQSHMLYQMKDAAKRLVRRYVEGVPFTEEIDPSVPEGIAQAARSGELSEQFLLAWYSSTVKGQFNGIYGTQAQDVYKPDYEVVDGEFKVDRSTIVGYESWERLEKDTCKVLFPYGLRIVGGSRLHLVLAIEMIWTAFGDCVKVMGGDTDSLKVAVGSSGVTDDDLSACLRSLAIASERAIDQASSRARSLYPERSSELSGVGSFEVENPGEPYVMHMEAWNKCRVSLDASGRCHVTAAGLRRPKGLYTMEDFMSELSSVHGFERIAPLALSYNVEIAHEICHSLERTHPGPRDVFEADVTDNLGRTSHVRRHEAIALFPSSRELGETTKRVNLENARHLRKLGKLPKMLEAPKECRMTDEGPELVVRGYPQDDVLRLEQDHQLRRPAHHGGDRP